MTRCILLLLLLLARASTECSPLPCLRDTGFPGNDLNPPPGLPNPFPAAGYQGCAFACYARPECVAFTSIDTGTGACAAPGGCCLLKHAASSANTTPVIGHCSALLRAAAAAVPPPAPPSQPPAGARSVLHIIVDDLRAELSPFTGSSSLVSTPHAAALAAGGTTFSRAYAAIAVCSPSRMSFLTGRLPARTRTWNFLNHIRQGTCQDEPDVQFNDDTYAFLNASSDWGGAGQCCTFCAADAACAAWVYKEAAGTCHLKKTAVQRVRAVGAISGLRGSLATRAWTTLPGNFLRNGYTVLGAGKIFHADNGGLGPAPFDGSGMPPLQDPLSWTRAPNATMGNVNAVACSWPCTGAACAVNASADGVPAAGVPPLTDKVTGDDGLAKLTAALASGAPFYVAVGFRKPHLPFRAPAPYHALYPAVADIPLPRFPTLDASVPPIAYHASSLWGDPYTAMPAGDAQRERLNYYAAISWIDHQIGALLAALDASGRANDVLVALHSDHGYSLGESGSWEKFTDFEYGTRVPLIIRAPWVDGSVGLRSDALVELTDLYPTIMELAGVPLPPGEDLDGASLAPLMRGGAGPRDSALSVYPRCPADTSNTSDMYRENDCCTVERSAFFSLGVSLRTDAWRYTEWPVWNGSALEPDWSAPLIGAELYNHTGDDSTSFDSPSEVLNLADDPSLAPLRAQLSAQLRQAYARGNVPPS